MPALGMCCSSGKVKLPEIETPPEPLHGLLIGTDPNSSLFLRSIRQFNSCFQMTSFGATEIVKNTAANGQQFNSTFKIKGQIYHKVGSLLPMQNEPYKFLQIYFMGGEDSERALANRVNTRCNYNHLNSPFATRIVSELDALLNEHNELLKLFKSHMHKLQSDNHAIFINPDRTPAGGHIRRFNAPVVDDVAGIMVGDHTATRQIVIRRRNNSLQSIPDTHRLYDALQYPLIFWKGQDGYCINLKQRDPVTAIKLPTAILIFQKRAQRSVAGHVNMRVQTLHDPSAETFSKQLLDIGNGKVAVHDNTESIKLPTGFCTIVHSQDVLIDCIFPDVHTQYINLEWLAERAILAAKNVDVHGLNFKIQQLLPTDSVSYKSVNTVCNTIESVNYPVEFLNSLDLPGMPPHHLQLKVGSPVILLRNLNPPRLCNGTRLVIKKLMKNVIEATILNGKFQAKR
ncbi:uncharacterized protein LOC124459868 isoform X2 [Drosophila willistoni]|uniref:uncharacterized protein LOC124459868 isoform X2 n=1 Tax=Drosophila willistoni TaxID=7260 RepID=UPI001F082E02|nr:uncharacterized protein LOC124459868 isoform X2 [Drosophila willistoni]